MTNVVSLNQPLQIRDPESFVFFDTWKRPAYFTGRDPNKHYLDPQHSHIVRMQSDAPVSLGIVGSKYTLVPFRDVVSACELGFKSAGADMAACIVKDSCIGNGEKVMRQYIWENQNFQADNKSRIMFRSILMKGNDGTGSIRILFGAIDAFCTNGMIIGDYDTIAKRHTGDFVPKLDFFRERMETGFKIFSELPKSIFAMRNMSLSLDQAREILVQLNTSSRFIDMILQRWHVEGSNRGYIQGTMWTLYSALTWWATHHDVRNTGTGREEVTRLQRSRDVHVLVMDALDRRAA